MNIYFLSTFYVIAVYFGLVGIKNTRHAVVCGLIADFAGIVTRNQYGIFVFSLKENICNAY